MTEQRPDLSLRIAPDSNAEESRDDSQRFLESIIDNIPSMILVKDATDLRVVSCNQMAADFGGHERSALIGKSSTDLLGPRAAVATDTAERAALSSGTVIELPVVEVETPLGTRFVRTRKVPIRTEGLTYDFVLSISEDITEARRAEAALAEAYEETRHTLASLERNNRAMIQLNELGDLLQGCLTFEEACLVIAEIVPSIFPGCAGALSLVKPSRNFLEVVASWEQWPVIDGTFLPTECWALRRGRMHASGGIGPRCSHLKEIENGHTLCIPMVAQGETIGVFHLHLDANEEKIVADETESFRRLVLMTSEQIGLAIANLDLRDKLRHMSIRDPLTGLFNRRYMEETLEREVGRSRRNDQPLSIIQIDIDQFKTFNDTHGHEAGDVVLKDVATLIESTIRGGDVACRPGGEEITLILPDTSTDDAHEFAERLQGRLREMVIPYRGSVLPAPTISIGFATFPVHSEELGKLMRLADEALYAAKTAGRDCIVCATSSD